jgi:micrococcal nuclease
MRTLLTLSISALLAAPCAAEEYSGKVVGVHDGDTVTVFDGTVAHKVRLAGIDAPEKSQAFGEASKKNLSALIFQKPVSVEVQGRDRYRREVGWLRRGEVLVNKRQIETGYAWLYRKYSADAELAKAELEAKERRLGLWRDASAIAPWDFRKVKAAKNVH